MITLPAPGDAARLPASCTIRAGRCSGTSGYGVWRAAEDDPDSALYAESPRPGHGDQLHHRPRLTRQPVTARRRVPARSRLAARATSRS